MKYLFKVLVLGGITLVCQSCKKDFLDPLPGSSIVQPNSLEDFRRLLDNQNVVGSSPALPMLACDDYYYKNKAGWEAARTSIERNSYVWDVDVYGGERRSEDWNDPYTAIFYANNVLANIDQVYLNPADTNEYRQIKGTAHFIRAFTYFELIKNFSKNDLSTAKQDLGVPLKLKPEIDEILPRASVEECYSQIFSDLSNSMTLLTLTRPSSSRIRPSRLAAYALAARINLSLRRYDRALLYADSSLTMYNKLIDYNTLNTTSTTPFDLRNDELIFKSQCISYFSINYLNPGGDVSVDSSLINSYSTNDLRFMIYFTPLPTTDGYYVKRSYNGSGLSNFNGLAVDELYLTKAECLARRGEPNLAMEVLNKLLESRFVTGSYVPLTAVSANEALAIVLKERRKSLVYRGLRWDDLKRLNKEGANITLTRVLDGKVYTLPPNDPRYVFNIPDEEIAFSGLIQNER